MGVIKKVLKIAGWALLSLVALIALLFVYFNLPVKKMNDAAQLGVTFSHRYAGDIGLNWQETFIAMLDDLKIKKIRIPIYWDLVETEEGKYDFSAVDWQIKEAAKRNAEIILVVGQKVPRWPECAIPAWAKENDQKRKSRLLQLIAIAVDRYKDESVVKFWQVENEPFLKFGICPKLDTGLLDAELMMVKIKDPSRKIIVTDSGELSLWVQAAARADIFGTTMYRSVWNKNLGYYDYPIGPRFFHFKYWMSRFLTGQKNVITIELQGEPWVLGWTTSAPLETQFASMNELKLVDNIEFAKKVGFSEIYVWGVEWWYWLKTQKENPQLWETARIEFAKNVHE
jgi:hypothetical protein